MGWPWVGRENVTTKYMSRYTDCATSLLCQRLLLSGNELGTMAKSILLTLLATLLPISSATPQPGSGYITVSVSTLWTSPSSPRPIDTPALQNPAQIQQWLDSMTTAQYLDLTSSSRTQTQALYGTQVYILNSTTTDKGEMWYEIAVPGQLTKKNGLGYPGWVPAGQVGFGGVYGHLQKTKDFAQVERAATVALYRDPLLRRKVMDLSYATRLPVVGSYGRAIQVLLPSGRLGFLLKEDAEIYESVEEIPYPSGEDLVTAGALFLNRPYLWGGTSGFAFDCAGFTGTLYRSHGIPMARDSGAQGTMEGAMSVERKDLKMGDLLFYAHNVSDSETIHHVAMYAGDGEMMEAYGAGVPVRRTAVRFGEEYWGARRYLK